MQRDLLNDDETIEDLSFYTQEDLDTIDVSPE